MNRSNEMTRPRFVSGSSSFATMLMLEADYEAVYRLGRYAGPDGLVDWKLAAKAGVRIFVFVDADALARVPERRPFAVGTTDDLYAIIGGGKVRVENRGNAILNPLQNRWPEELSLAATPDLAVCSVTAGEFRKAFGPKRFTSRFPREV
jgi:hypothetical protein